MSISLCLFVRKKPGMGSELPRVTLLVSCRTGETQVSWVTFLRSFSSLPPSSLELMGAGDENILLPNRGLQLPRRDVFYAPSVTSPLAKKAPVGFSSQE